MKKVVLLGMALVFISFISLSCGDGVPQNGDDSDSQVQDESETVDESEDIEVSDADEVVDEAGDSTVNDDEVVDDAEVPDDGQIKKVGEFDLSFNGKINVNLSDYQNIKGGLGEVNFSHNGADLLFGELTVIIMQLFPIAIVQEGNVAIMWLDSAPGMGGGAEIKQVFGFTYPATMTTVGDQKMEDVGAYAFYGDINIDLQNSIFEIKCVRSAAIAGRANFISVDAANVNLEASGDLLDPSVAASQLPYPVCPE